MRMRTPRRCRTVEIREARSGDRFDSLSSVISDPVKTGTGNAFPLNWVYLFSSPLSHARSPSGHWFRLVLALLFPSCASPTITLATSAGSLRRNIIANNSMVGIPKIQSFHFPRNLVPFRKKKERRERERACVYDYLSGRSFLPLLV